MIAKGSKEGDTHSPFRRSTFFLTTHGCASTTLDAGGLSLEVMGQAWRLVAARHAYSPVVSLMQ